MTALLKHLRSFLASEEAATAIEYAVMILLIILVCISVVSTIGGNVNRIYSGLASSTAR